MDKESVLKAFAEFQALGMITLANDFSASVNPPDRFALLERNQKTTMLLGHPSDDQLDHLLLSVKQLA